MMTNLIAPQVEIPADNSKGFLAARMGNERAGREQSSDYHQGFSRGELVNRQMGENLAPTKGGAL